MEIHVCGIKLLLRQAGPELQASLTPTSKLSKYMILIYKETFF